VLAFGLLALVGLSLSKGPVRIDFFHMDDLQREIILRVRLPRVLLSGLVGAALSVSGVLFQYVMKNPLADSFTTGVSSSAALGAVLAILIGGHHLVPLMGLLGGLAGLWFVYRVASYRGTVEPLTMLLAGIVVSTFGSACISLIKYLSDEGVSAIVFWLMGGFQNASLERVGIFSFVLALSFVFLQKRALGLDIIAFDETTARSSGLDVDRLRKEAFFFGTLLTAVSVGYAGIIGFVGLIVPHLLRLLGFVRAKDLLGLSALAGAGFMVLNDLVARTILPQGQELPVGIITSSLGGAFFLYLLITKKRQLYGID
ncbi:MAG: iron ABC transporter permease, partial [Nitrospirae bacterium]